MPDYQMAAYLLRLPSIIRSEQYSMLNPLAHIAYIHYVAKQKQTDKILDKLIEEANDKMDSAAKVDHSINSFVVENEEEDMDEYEYDIEQDEEITLDSEIMDDNSTEQQEIVIEPTAQPERKVEDPKSILYQLGYMENFPVKEGKKTYRMIFPQCSRYANRGQKLKHMNQIEYNALIKFKEPSQSENKRLEEFQFSEGYQLHGIAVQTIMAKQRTPMVIRKPPRHPGKEPDKDSPKYNTWLKNANEYAEFYLVLF